jgi:hypothetical protein
MADPAVESAQKRLEIEEAIARVMVKEGEIMVQNEKLKAAQAAGNLREIQAAQNEIGKLEGKIEGLRKSTGIVTSQTSNFSRAIKDVGTSSASTRSSIGGVSDATGMFGAATGAVIDQLVQFREQLQGISQDRYDFVTSISEAIGGSSRFYALNAEKVNSFDEEMSTYQRNNLDRMQVYYRNLGSLAKINGKDLSDAQMEVIGAVGAGSDAFQKGQFAARKFFGLASGFRKDAQGQILPDGFFRIQGIPVEDVFGSAAAAMQPLTDILSDETLTTAFSKRIHDEESAEAVINDTLRMSTAIKAFGISSAQATELVRLNYINTGEASTDYFNTVVKAATYGEKAFGYSSQLIISDVIKMSNNFDTFGFRTAEDFAKISAAAHDVHLTINDLQSVMGKFNTFESAAGAVGQLNAALGTNFDAMELMTLKFEDPAQFIQRLRDGFVSAGKTFEDLPQTYRSMITQQLGITMEGLRGIMDGSARNLDDLTQQQEDATALYDKAGQTEAEKQAALDEIVKGRVKITGDMIESAGNMAEQAMRAANRYENTTNLYIQRTAEVADSINDTAAKIAQGTIPMLRTQIESQVAAMSGVLKGVLDNAKLTQDAIKEVTAAARAAYAASSQLAADFEKNFPGFIDAAKGGGAPRPLPVPDTTPPTPAFPGGDVVVSPVAAPGGSTVLTKGFGEMGEMSVYLDDRDWVRAGPLKEPTPEPQPAPQQAQRTNLPAVSDAIRASLQGVGTSLRIELDVGQLTDLVLRDIMMNKPNVFGGIG